MNDHLAVISQPIFLVGAERSGTTLLRLMLDHHPRIAFHSEFEFVVDYFQDHNYPLLDDYYEHLAIDRLFQSSNFTIDPNLSYPQLVNSFLVQKRENTGKHLVGATVHRHFDRLLKIWPDAKFIHLIRDGRDVARSCMNMNWGGNIWTASDRWIEVEQLWSQLKTTISPDRYIEVRYETLITETETTLTDVCNFMGTNYESTMLSYAQTSTYDLPNPALLFQWQDKLSRQDIQLIEAKIGSLLLKYDYELSDFPPLTLSFARKQALKLHSKLALIQGRINIYGLPLILSSVLSRFLNLRLWQRQVQLQFNCIDSIRLK
jgi:hypothetical protein